MGQSKMRRLMVILMALVMTMAMVIPSFAATNSPSEGGTAKAATITKVTTDAQYASKAIKVNFTGKNATKGYKISYRIAGGQWKTVKTTNKSSYTIKNLKQGKLYQVKVAGINKDGKTGKYSTIRYRYLAKTTPKVTSTKTKTMKVTWSKVSGATGYRIIYSKNSNMSNAKTYTVKSGSKTSATISGLTKGKTYYVRIRPLKKYSGATYVGMRSAKKTVKVK